MKQSWPGAAEAAPYAPCIVCGQVPVDDLYTNGHYKYFVTLTCKCGVTGAQIDWSLPFSAAFDQALVAVVEVWESRNRANSGSSA
jgi:hypothetical protein